MKFQASKNYVQPLICILLLLVCMSMHAGIKTQNAMLSHQLADLQKSVGGRLGIYAIETKTQTVYQYHAQQHFPLCSTAKLMAVAAVLKKSMSDHQLLQQTVPYSKKSLSVRDVIPAEHLASTMTVSQLCAAALTVSDQQAMTLLVQLLGGPQAVTQFARSIGDQQFKLTRREPFINDMCSEDGNTTTPKAMAISLAKLTLGNVLARTQRDQLRAWLIESSTGNKRICASVPMGWVVANKAGTGDYGTTNDIGVIWPPHCAPIVLAVYYTQDQRHARPNDQVVADAARLVLATITKQDTCFRKMPAVFNGF